MTLRIPTPLDGTRSEHGEGPLWCPDGTLRWVDMLVGDVVHRDSESRVTRIHVGTVAAALRPRRSGGFVVAVERGFALLTESNQVQTLPEIWTDTVTRMNEGSCDPDGNFYCGSMGWGAEAGLGSMYRLDPEGRVTRVLDGVSVSNGLAFSPDGDRAYFVDSATNTISRIDVRGGVPSWADRTTHVTIDPALGIPDGICLDSEGDVWVALWGGGAVHRYSTHGHLTDIVTLPTAHPTACVLGGADLSTLFITTSRLVTPEDPLAGAVFHVEVDIPGQPALTYAG